MRLRECVEPLSAAASATMSVRVLSMPTKYGQLCKHPTRSARSVPMIG